MQYYNVYDQTAKAEPSFFEKWKVDILLGRPLMCDSHIYQAPYTAKE